MISQKMDVFWQEYDAFKNKSGSTYGSGRVHIWNSAYTTSGDSHLWHNLYSVPFTKFLGFVACHVTSKNLGIGAAKRSWGVT